MSWIKRIFLFLAINILILLTISFLLRLFNIQPYLSSRGMNYQALLTFCFIWGMAGAFISLLLSRPMAKWMMGVRVIDPSSSEYSFLIHMVKKLSEDAGLSHPPQMGIYSSHEVNAFATGATKRASLIAVSSALLQKMNHQEIEAILGHEMAHIANGDMVTMTLLQGVVNAFVMFLARAIAFALSGFGKDNKHRDNYMGFSILVFLFEIVFMLLGSIVVATFSRAREYRADRGGARLAGKEKMIQALERLKATQQIHDPATAKPAYQALKISSSSKKGLIHLFATHPSLEDRIQKLREE